MPHSYAEVIKPYKYKLVDIAVRISQCCYCKYESVNTVRYRGSSTGVWVYAIVYRL